MVQRTPLLKGILLITVRLSSTKSKEQLKTSLEDTTEQKSLSKKNSKFFPNNNSVSQSGILTLNNTLTSPATGPHRITPIVSRTAAISKEKDLNHKKRRNNGTKNLLKEIEKVSKSPVMTKRGSVRLFNTMQLPPEIETKKTLSPVKRITNPKMIEDFQLNPIETTQNNNNEISESKLNMISQVTKGSGNNNIRVFVRFRPLNDVETELIENGVGTVCVDYLNQTDEGFCNTIQIRNPNGNVSHPYRADRVFQSDTEQHVLYDYFGKDIVKDVLSGYNGTIFAYGQSGSGKTYTMYGSNLYDDNLKGVIPRLIQDIFDAVNTAEDNVIFQFKMSFLQIYKEVIYDLLTGEKDLKIKENPIRGIYVDKLTEVYVNTFEAFMDYVDLAQQNRIVSETKLNQVSSRSHSILIFEVTQNVVNENFSKSGKLNLVDLAGSEKISKTGAVGETLEEAKKINLSLSALGNVIHALTSGAEHIPYRDSKLTRILQESLGGNFKTSLIVTCSPHSYHLEETTSSLQFASRVKRIKNKVKINVQLTYEELQKIIRQLRHKLDLSQKEIERLRALVPESVLLENGLDHTQEDKNKSNNVNKNLFSNTSEDVKKIMSSDDLSSVSLQNDLSNTNFMLSRHNKDESNLSDVEPEKRKEKSSSSIIKIVPIQKQEEEEKNKEGEVLIKSKTDKDEEVQHKEEHDDKIEDDVAYKIIRQLKLKIETLNNEIKEKDVIISSLEKSKKESHVEEKKSPLRSSYTNETVLKSLNDLYDEINAKLGSLNDKYKDIQNFEIDMTKYNQSTSDFIEQLKKKCEIHLKNNFDNSSNGHILFFDTISSLLSKTLQIYKNDSNSEFTFNANSDLFKQNVSRIFDDIFLLSQSKTKTTEAPLLKLISLFIFGYLDSYVTIQLISQLNYKLNSENIILKNTNNTLSSIVESILKSNIELGNIMSNIQNMKLKSSIVDTGFNMTFAGELPPQSDGKRSFVERPAPRRLSTKKILTFVTKKNMDVMKSCREKNKNSSNNLFNVTASFVNNTSLKASGVNLEGITEENNNNSLFTGNSIQIPPQKHLSMFLNKMDKKLSKLQMIKQFIIKSLQQEEKFKREQEMITNNLKMTIKQCERDILGKLVERKILEPKELEYYDNENMEQKNKLSLSSSNDLDNSERDIKDFDFNDGSKLNSNPNQVKYKTSNASPKNTKLNRQVLSNINNTTNTNEEPSHYTNLKSFTNKTDLFSSARNLPPYPSYFEMSRTSYPFILNTAHNSDLNKNVSMDFINTNMFNLTPQKPVNLETIITDYLETGTATRKFDGIAIKVENNKVRYSYSGGLNANNTIPNIPIHQQIMSNNGDESLIIEDDDIEDTK